MPDEPPAAVLAALGAGRCEVTALSDVPDGNANWLISGDSGHRLVLRRHHPEATPAGLAWEHATLSWSYGVRPVAARRRPRAEEESDIGTRRPALARPKGGILP